MSPLSALNPSVEIGENSNPINSDFSRQSGYGLDGVPTGMSFIVMPIVLPWIVILANNVEIVHKGRKRVRRNDNQIKEELSLKGFQPLKVFALWNNKAQTEFAIDEFGKELGDFHNAMRPLFEPQDTLCSLGLIDDDEVMDDMYDCLLRLVDDPGKRAKVDYQLDDFKARK
ncbi:XH/XS domain protein [Trifolium pratense]|uniref:XH/XS domain protein n=1 Tax=Trifolium pratense TaxID=57577 RepID=A0A2K3NVD8_TRIPR|nr:XH/XS domain protein [Trifolium pratense]